MQRPCQFPDFRSFTVPFIPLLITFSSISKSVEIIFLKIYWFRFHFNCFKRLQFFHFPRSMYEMEMPHIHSSHFHSIFIIPFEISMLFGILLLFNRVSASSNDYVNVLVVSYGCWFWLLLHKIVIIVICHDYCSTCYYCMLFGYIGWLQKLSNPIRYIFSFFSLSLTLQSILNVLWFCTEKVSKSKSGLLNESETSERQNRIQTYQREW